MPRYELLAGQHIQADTRRPIDPKTGKHPSRVYKAEPGRPLPVFESDHPLVAADRRKFRRVDAPEEVPPLTDDAPEAPAATLPELESLTLAELKALAAREQIALGGARTRDEVIAAIRAEA